MADLLIFGEPQGVISRTVEDNGILDEDEVQVGVGSNQSAQGRPVPSEPI
ncbi:unnamed protein product, partial [Didymodactylos carnosus]